MMRSLLLVLPAVTFVILTVACGGGSGGDHTATPTAIASPAPADSLQAGEWRDCVLHGGGPAPGFEVEGRCFSESVLTGDGLRVTEVHEWRCEDFSGDVQGYEPCSGEFGRYTIISMVRGGVSEVVSVSGQFPPELVQ